MGCGCGSNFSGKSNFVKKDKPCTCGRNPGGSCQCNNTNRMPDSRWQRPQGLGTNWNSSSSLMGGNVSQAMSAPLSASGGNMTTAGTSAAAVGLPWWKSIFGGGGATAGAGVATAASTTQGQYQCRDIYGGVYYSNTPCVNEYGVPAAKKQNSGSGANNNMKRELHDNRKKFSSFMGKNVPKRKHNHFVDIKKHNISPEHYFEYNSRPFETLRRTNDSFKNYNDLHAMNYEL